MQKATRAMLISAVWGLRTNGLQTPNAVVGKKSSRKNGL
jgi:hypothetical protein